MADTCGSCQTEVLFEDQGQTIEQAKMIGNCNQCVDAVESASSLINVDNNLVKYIATGGKIIKKKKQTPRRQKKKKQKTKNKKGKKEKRKNKKTKKTKKTKNKK